MLVQAEKCARTKEVFTEDNTPINFIVTMANIGSTPQMEGENQPMLQVSISEEKKWVSP